MEKAIIETGGKQYMVEVGQKIRIEKLAQDVKKGDSVTFDKVLLVTGKETLVGTPHVKAVVSATVQMTGNRDKLIVLKYKAKSRYQKKNGHKQPFVEVKIDSIK